MMNVPPAQSVALGNRVATETRSLIVFGVWTEGDLIPSYTSSSPIGCSSLENVEHFVGIETRTRVESELLDYRLLIRFLVFCLTILGFHYHLKQRFEYQGLRVVTVWAWVAAGIFVCSFEIVPESSLSEPFKGENPGSFESECRDKTGECGFVIK